MGTSWSGWWSAGRWPRWWWPAGSRSRCRETHRRRRRHRRPWSVWSRAQSSRAPWSPERWGRASPWPEAKWPGGSSASARGAQPPVALTSGVPRPGYGRHQHRGRRSTGWSHQAWWSWSHPGQSWWRREPWWSSRPAVLDGLKGGNSDRRRPRTRPGGAQHGSKEQLGRLADDLQRPGRVLDARQLDDHVVALAADVGLGHAEGVDPLAHDRDGLVEDAAVDLALGLQDDRRSALKIEAKEGLVARGQGCAKGDHRDRDDSNKRVPQRFTHRSVRILPGGGRRRLLESAVSSNHARRGCHRDPRHRGAARRSGGHRFRCAGGASLARTRLAHLAGLARTRLARTRLARTRLARSAGISISFSISIDASPSTSPSGSAVSSSATSRRRRRPLPGCRWSRSPRTPNRRSPRNRRGAG